MIPPTVPPIIAPGIAPIPPNILPTDVPIFIMAGDRSVASLELTFNRNTFSSHLSPFLLFLVASQENLQMSLCVIYGYSQCMIHLPSNKRDTNLS